jgi:hypothetical protein
VGIHGPAAAGAAVADGVEAPQHGVFEEGVVDMAPAMFLFQDRRRFFGGNPAAAARMVIRHEGGKGLSHDQADIQGKTGIGADGAAGTFQGYDVIGLPEDQVPGKRIGNDALEIIQAYFPPHLDQPLRRLKRHHLAVIAIGKRGLPLILFTPVPVPGIDPEDSEEKNTGALEDSRQGMIPRTNPDVEIRPSSVEVSMQEIQEGIAGDFPAFPDEFTGGRLQGQFLQEVEYFIHFDGSWSLNFHEVQLVLTFSRRKHCGINIIARMGIQIKLEKIQGRLSPVGWAFLSF